MNEIHVRGWDSEEKKMYYFNLINYMASDEMYQENLCSFYAQDNLMLSSGVQDQNEKLIYDGDILSTDLSRPYLVVKFRNGAFMLQCHDSGQDYWDYMFPVDAKDKPVLNHVKVIGNIHEDKNLLQ